MQSVRQLVSPTVTHAVGHQWLAQLHLRLALIATTNASLACHSRNIFTFLWTSHTHMDRSMLYAIYSAQHLWIFRGRFAYFIDCSSGRGSCHHHHWHSLHILQRFLFFQLCFSSPPSPSLQRAQQCAAVKILSGTETRLIFCQFNAPIAVANRNWNRWIAARKKG